MAEHSVGSSSAPGLERSGKAVVFPDITCDDIFRVETSRLWLRWLRSADAPALAAFASLAETARMTALIPHPYPAGEAERFILTARAATAAGQALILAVTLKNKSRIVIGVISAQTEAAHVVEVGYVIAPNQAGRGFATEALRAMVDVVFNLTETRTIAASSRRINPASRRVLEKSGFSLVASGLKDLPARGGQYPCDFFRLDRHAWASQLHVRRLPGMSHQTLRQQPSSQGEQNQ